MMTAMYFPSDSAAMPAETCAVSWAEKATMPKGRAQIRAWISRKRRS